MPVKDELDVHFPPPSELDKQLAGLDTDARVALLRRENRKLQDKIREKETGLDIVKQAFADAYSEPINLRLPTPPKQTKKRQHEEAVLHITDTHFGKKTATYNATVAAERLVLLCEAVREIITLRREYANIRTLKLLLGGDLGEGDGLIFPGQAHEIDQGLVEQILKFGPEQIGSVVLAMLALFETVEIIAVPGNHGRQAPQSAKRWNADSILYHALWLMFKGTDTNKRIKWNLPLDRTPGDEWFAHFKMCELWGGVLVHGDQVRGQLGFPWYGYGKKVAGWASCLPAFDYLFAGHHHTDASFDLHGRHVFATGSTESDNTYAKENMAASGDPKQRLVICNRKYGVISDHPIYLSDREPHA